MKTPSTKYDFYSYLSGSWSIYHHEAGMNRDYVKRIFQLLHAALEAHSKVFVLRFDLRFSSIQATDTNKLLSEFNRKLMDWLRTEYKCEPHYLWAREQETAQQPHYHNALLLNGHKVRYHSKIKAKIKTLWHQVCGGSASIPTDPFYHFHRNDLEQRQAALYRLTYLAKSAGKNTRKRLRHFGSSNQQPSSNESWGKIGAWLSEQSTNTPMYQHNQQHAEIHP